MITSSLVRYIGCLYVLMYDILVSDLLRYDILVAWLPTSSLAGGGCSLIRAALAEQTASSSISSRSPEVQDVKDRVHAEVQEEAMAD